MAAESDRFSTYVLAYKGASKESPKPKVTTPQRSQAATQRAKAAGTSLANTGDPTPAHLAGIVAIMVLAASGILGVAKRIR